VPAASIDEDLKLAVLVAEDIEFFRHQGFSTSELRSSLEQAWERGRAPRGASTLTQQLAKNLWLDPSRNPLRKAKEALLTRQLERELSKGRILELYLNVVEFGPGVWGAEAAARRYFGRPAATLDERQAAELAAGLPRPSTWHPGVTTAGYRKAVDRVLGRMGRAAWLRGEIRAHAR
jgi:monofunctional biosynthetic peptidoglycan transglycosylase